MEAIDISFYNSLKFVLDNDPADLELTFAVEEESFGEVKEANNLLNQIFVQFWFSKNVCTLYMGNYSR